MSSITEWLKRARVIPVIVIDDAAHASSLAEALASGGLPCAEITLRTAAGIEAIQRIADAWPDVMVGAGTVLSPEQAERAINAGATFIVSPGFNPAVVDFCQERGTPVFPGVCTPTEIEMALAKGLTTVKFFPAAPMGGINYLRAIAAPYGMMQFIPTGGINSSNIAEYLAFSKVLACGGSWMAPAEWIGAGAFGRIRDETARAVQTVAAVGAAA